ncbi:MAG: hypothetical protein HXX16_18785 [Bacteroidales bacterium]|nr:hypothetical protein [Bacteroidales bacterium]
MDTNFDNLLNNLGLTNDNLSIEGMENFKTDDVNLDTPTQDIPEQMSSNQGADSLYYFDEGGDSGGGGGTDVAYGSSTFGLFEDSGNGDGGGSGGVETAYGPCAFSETDVNK